MLQNDSKHSRTLQIFFNWFKTIQSTSRPSENVTRTENVFCERWKIEISVNLKNTTWNMMFHFWYLPPCAFSIKNSDILLLFPSFRMYRRFFENEHTVYCTIFVFVFLTLLFQNSGLLLFWNSAGGSNLISVNSDFILGYVTFTAAVGWNLGRFWLHRQIFGLLNSVLFGLLSQQLMKRRDALWSCDNSAENAVESGKCFHPEPHGSTPPWRICLQVGVWEARSHSKASSGATEKHTSCCQTRTPSHTWRHNQLQVLFKRLEQRKFSANGIFTLSEEPM